MTSIDDGMDVLVLGKRVELTQHYATWHKSGHPRHFRIYLEDKGIPGQGSYLSGTLLELANQMYDQYGYQVVWSISNEANRC